MIPTAAAVVEVQLVAGIVHCTAIHVFRSISVLPWYFAGSFTMVLLYILTLTQKFFGCASYFYLVLYTGRAQGRKKCLGVIISSGI